MTLRLVPRLAALALLCAAAAGHAATLQAVEIRGVQDATLRDNIAQMLSLQQLSAARRKNLREGRLRYLLRQAPAEVRTALQPYGYYDPTITIDERRRGDAVTVVLTIDPGTPVRVRAQAVTLHGDGSGDRSLLRELRRFEPDIGDVFAHPRYETSKARVTRALLERGYFDAELSTHRVEVTRAQHAADITLRWGSGARYTLGAVEFGRHQFRSGLLEQLLAWQPGTPYHQDRLLDLQRSLTALDYFSYIDVQPQPEQAVDRRVPVTVGLTPARRTVYSAGVAYGTDSGAGVTLGMDRRWVNNRGHKLAALLDVAQYRQTITSRYRIPAFDRLEGWYTASASLREYQDVTSQSTNALSYRQLELVGARNGRIGDWTVEAGLHLLRERYEDPTRASGISYTSLIYPALRAQIASGDDPLYPRRGYGLTLELRSGLDSLGSDTDFVQALAQARWVRGLGERNRLLLRGELGYTAGAADASLLPPSLRYYAGGDRSVRGYGYREIGPRLGDKVLGAQQLAVVSVELEHMFTPRWGMAAFVDAGDAWNDSLDPQIGVGLGLRWRSPVGPVRVDIGHGLDDADSALRLHINIGTDL